MKIFLFLFLSFVYLLEKGQVPPELAYYSLAKGKKIIYKGDDFKDNVFLIDFWATWCAPCIESIPHLNSFVEKYKGRGVKFISITYEPEKLVKKFLGDHPMKSDVGLDEDFYLFRSYNGWAVPNIVMINSKGKFSGRIHPNNLTDEVIETLLTGGIPEVKNTPEDAFDPIKAEEYFRSYLEKQKE